MNSVQLIGRLTRDVDLRYTQSGKAVANFTLAIDKPGQNEQGNNNADFIECVFWEKKAENFANFTAKGSKVGVEGRLQTRTYDHKDGYTVKVTEVVVYNFHLLEPKSVTDQRRQQNGENYQNQQQGYNQGNYGGQNNYQYNQQPQQPSQQQQAPQTGYQNNNQGYYQQPTQNPQNGANFNQYSSQPVKITEDQLPF